MKFKHSSKISILLFVMVFTAGSVVRGQTCPPSAGCVDTTFFGGGKFTYGIGSAVRVQARDIIVLDDGKFLVLSVAESNPSGVNVLRRHNADGSTDNSFGPNGDGSIYFDWRVNGSTTGGASMMKLQQVGTDTRIVLAGVQPLGSNPVALRVERWMLDGSLDTSFGINSKFVLNSTATRTMAIDQQQNIVLGGTNATYVRLQRDGVLDSTFGSGGTLQSKSGVNAGGITFQPSGRIVVAGAVGQGGSKNRFTVARLNIDGSYDDGSRTDTTKGDSFGSGGKVVPFGNTSSSASRVYVDPLGRIVAGGSVGLYSTNDWGLVRLLTNGQFDTTFSGDGRLTYDFAGAGDSVMGIVFQVSGPSVKMYAGGEASFSGHNNFGLVAFNENGTVDLAFGESGRVLLDFYGGTDLMYQLALQIDPACGCPKLIAIGSAETVPDQYHGAAARFVL